MTGHKQNKTEGVQRSTMKYFRCLPARSGRWTRCLHGVLVSTSETMTLVWRCLRFLASRPKGTAKIRRGKLFENLCRCRIRGVLATNNYGGAGVLAVASSAAPKGEFQSVLQFDLSTAKTLFDTQFGTLLSTAPRTVRRPTTLGSHLRLRQRSAGGQQCQPEVVCGRHWV
jgi:hypothetical protein